MRWLWTRTESWQRHSRNHSHYCYRCWHRTAASCWRWNGQDTSGADRLDGVGVGRHWVDFEAGRSVQRGRVSRSHSVDVVVVVVAVIAVVAVVAVGMRRSSVLMDEMVAAAAGRTWRVEELRKVSGPDHEEEAAMQLEPEPAMVVQAQQTADTETP